MARGQLRIYLGAAPGVGKTYAALEEAHRRASRGTDVVVGFVETHGREHTGAMIGDLEIVPRRTIEYRGASFTEFDLDAVLARAPRVVLVDELAHTNVPGSRFEKRWQDIDVLLDAGIDVLSTVNIQHLESLNDVVTKITGVPQQETVPDEVVRRADQVELVDMTPEALRRRMTHGNVYPPDKIDASLSNYFRVGNLTALRELALLWLADKVDEQLAAYRRDKDISETWEARERVVVALSGGEEGDTLIRRAARIAARSGADLQAVYVAGGDGLNGTGSTRHLARQRLLVESLGGTYHQVVGDDIPQALLDFARGVNATQLVLGASRRGRAAQLFSRGVGVTTTAQSGSIDVHLVTHEKVGRGSRRTGLPGAISRMRMIAGFALTVLGLPALTAIMHPWRDDLSLTTDLLVYLSATLLIALIGGIWPALVASLAGFALLDFYFVQPYNTLTIATREHLFNLLLFVLMAVLVAVIVGISARKTAQAAQARAEAHTLAALAGSVLRGDHPLQALLEQVRETFGLTSVTLLELGPEPGVGPGERRDPNDWRVVACVGEPCTSPGAAETDIPVGDELSLALRGRTLPASDRRIVEAFAVQSAVALRQERLSAQAAAMRPVAAADKMRTALLAAVSHDLRTPLASAKAAVAGLRNTAEMFSPEERAELVVTADESLDRLGRLVANLLDMSRLQAGVLGARPVPIWLEEAVPPALDEIGEPAAGVTIRIADDLPAVSADPGLLERILVNIIGNALRHSPPDRPPLVSASAHAGLVELRVIDHGPGVPEDAQELIFTPFQRLGDQQAGTGVGLGLALSRGLAESMGGTLLPEDTPGGGLTMVLTLPETGE
ncbi:sensor histidine kinase [Actinorhabdospora filicis]|nr:sensor histidine kinase KdpD [Actinorhabdospora filicis]